MYESRAREILRTINEWGIARQDSLVNYIGISRQRLSDHLKVLIENNLIDVKREVGTNRKKYYITELGKAVLNNKDWGVKTRDELHGDIRGDFVNIKTTQGYTPVVYPYYIESGVDIAGYVEETGTTLIIENENVEVLADAVVEELKKGNEVELIILNNSLKKRAKELIQKKLKEENLREVKEIYLASSVEGIEKQRQRTKAE